jgi:2-haloacid dehalogenase
LGESGTRAEQLGDWSNFRSNEVQTAFIERPLEFGPDSPVYEDPGADVSAADLHELAQRLAN